MKTPWRRAGGAGRGGRAQAEKRRGNGNFKQGSAGSSSERSSMVSLVIGVQESRAGGIPRSVLQVDAQVFSLAWRDDGHTGAGKGAAEQGVTRALSSAAIGGTGAPLLRLHPASGAKAASEAGRRLAILSHPL